MLWAAEFKPFRSLSSGLEKTQQPGDIMNPNVNPTAPGSTASSSATHGAAAPKAAAIVNDTLLPMPDFSIRVAVLREQSSIPEGHALFRDHNSEDDPQLPDNGMVDLRNGNVFYSAPPGQRGPRESHPAPAKLAYVVDDRWEVVIKSAQTGQTLRDLFALAPDLELLRDFHSPDDAVVAPSDDASFGAGCVFRTRRHVAALTIKVNKLRFTEKDGVKPKMTGREIAVLVEPDPDQTKVERLTTEGPVPVGLKGEAPIANGDEFKVIRCNVNAGYQDSRVEREVEQLRKRGVRVTLVAEPAAVIYHDVPVHSRLPVQTTDVLVKVPSGYPGRIIDNAFLPEGSPLLNRTVGAEQHIEIIGGLRWKQKSIHPYTGSSVAWNKDLHGFHTYYGEMVSWLHAGQ